MGHLTSEHLARLVSEAPTTQERNHLNTCAACRAEMAAIQDQVEAVGALPDLRPPPGDWEVLEARLLSEGLIRSGGRPFRAQRWWSSGLLQAAAAIVLFLGGTVLGTRFSGSPPDLASFGEYEGDGVALVPVSTQPQPVSDLTDAAAAVRQAEQQYMLSLLQYRQLLDAQGESSYIGDPMSRFAALEAIVAAGRAAVQQAPADPFVNGLLVSALAERESLIRNASLNAGDGVF
jgi:hypothetical protein